MIQINGINGSIKHEVSVSSSCVHKYMLMSYDYISLSFESDKNIVFEIGDYIEYEESKYYITEKIYPTYNSSTGGNVYNINFYAHYYLWKNHILFYDRQGNRESSWSLTKSPDSHLSIVVSNIKSLGFQYNGKPYQAIIGDGVDMSAKLVQYENTNIIDALTKISETWDCEWWVIEDKIYIGKLEHGYPVKIEIGVEAETMTRSRSQDIYGTRLYVFGSTRNIPSDYRQGVTGEVVGGVVQKRLMLPEGTPYIDIKEGLKEEQIIDLVVTIDSVYPRLTGIITSVESETITETPEEGEQITYTIYRFRDINFHFSESYVLPGETLKVTFQTGSLSGMEFELKFNPKELPEDDPESQVFEIIRNENYGIYLPEDPLVPKVGDNYVLSGFDPSFVSDTLIPDAEKELLEEGLKVKDEIVSDPSTYTVELKSFVVSGYDNNTDTFNPEKKIDMLPGQKVNLINKSFFDNGRETRVIGYEKKIDKPYDKPKYTIGESASYSRIGDLEKRLQNIKTEGNIYIGQGGSGGGSIGVYIITKEDTTPATDQNVFSALRTLYEIYKANADINKKYLRKDIDDVAHGNILFEQKIGSREYIQGWDGKGWEIENNGSGELNSLWIRHDLLINGMTGSPIFVSGFPNGIGWDLSPYKRINAAEVEETKYRLEIDDIIVRGKLRVFEMVISQLRGENDNVIFAGMMRVDHYDEATGRIYLDTDEGVLYNPFREGDILMVQRFGGMPSEENDYNVIKQYELQVKEAGVGDLADEEKRLDWITFTNFVGELSDIAEGDVLTRVDSVTDSTRKGIVKVTTIDEIGAPYIDVVYGMKTDPENATKARMGNLSGIRTKSGIDLTGLWGIYGNGAYFENSTYILQNGNTIEQEFSIMNGEFNSIIGQIKNDMSLEAGNILVNSTFSENTAYWVVNNSGVHFFSFDGQFLLANGYFMSEKNNVADIFQDGSRNVLRLKNSGITQLNDVMEIPVHEETEEGEYTYSFSLYYKVITSGTLSVGIEGSELHISQELSPTNEYLKLSHAGKWNEKGDFVISYTGEIYIYGVSLFNDALADAEIRLQTQITQNAEAIKLTATKEYVDSETGAIYTKYDAELKVTAEEISQRVTRTEFDEETGALERRLEGKITVQADRIDAVVSDIDYINNTIETAGWITTAQGNQLYASKTLENGNTIVSYINQTATTISISASKINLNGAVTFSSFSSSLQQDFNDKVDSDSLSSTLANYVTKYYLSQELDDYALASDLSKYVNSTQLANELSKYASKTYADNSSKEAMDTVTNALVNGSTTIIGGLISTNLLDVDSIFANQATIADFEIKGTSLVGGNLILGGYIGAVYSRSTVNGKIIAGLGTSNNDDTTQFALYGRNDGGSGSAGAGNGTALLLKVGRSPNKSTSQCWIKCKHVGGYGSEFFVESRYMGDSNNMERTLVNVGEFATKTQVSGLPITHTYYDKHVFHPVTIDLATGYLCIGDI